MDQKVAQQRVGIHRCLCILDQLWEGAASRDVRVQSSRLRILQKGKKRGCLLPVKTACASLVDRHVEGDTSIAEEPYAMSLTPTVLVLGP
jgi:hypothetical protein